MMQIRFELSESKELHGIHTGQNHKQKSIFFPEGNKSGNMGFHKYINKY